MTPTNLAVIAFLSICAAMGCPAIPIAGTTLIITILSGMGWTSDLCMIAYALVVALNRPVEMALLPLNVIGDAAILSQHRTYRSVYGACASLSTPPLKKSPQAIAWGDFFIKFIISNMAVHAS